MQSSLIYIVIAACLLGAFLCFRRSGAQRWGFLAGVAMAAVVAVFSRQIIMLPNSMAQTVFLYVAIALGIIMLSVLFNKVFAFAALRMRAHESEAKEAVEQVPQLDMDDYEGEYASGAEGVIDIQAERKRRANKALPQDEEFFYEQSEPLMAEADDDAASVYNEVLDDEWMLRQESERAATMETQAIIEHHKQVAEAQAISGGAADLPTSASAPFRHFHEKRYILPDDGDMMFEAADEIAAEVDADGAVELDGIENNFIGQVESEAPQQVEERGPEEAIDILDKAWSYRDSGEWEKALEAYERFCSMIDDDRLRIEVEVEALNTMMSAREYERATDKVFEILSYAGELSENEKQQVTGVLSKMQSIE